MNRLRFTVLALVIVLALAPSVMAQSTTGSILGDVSDLSGAELPGATVRVTNNATKVRSRQL